MGLVPLLPAPEATRTPLWPSRSRPAVTVDRRGRLARRCAVPGLPPGVVVPGAGRPVQDRPLDLRRLPQPGAVPPVRPRREDRPRRVGRSHRGGAAVASTEDGGPGPSRREAAPTRRRAPGHLMGYGPRRPTPGARDLRLPPPVQRRRWPTTPVRPAGPWRRPSARRTSPPARPRGPWSDRRG